MSSGPRRRAKAWDRREGLHIFKRLRPILASLLVLSLATGMAYPLLVIGIAQLAFPEQANGSLLYDTEGKMLGSWLIA